MKIMESSFDAKFTRHNVIYALLSSMISFAEMARFTTDFATNVTTYAMVTSYLHCQIEDLKPFETVSWIRLKDDQILTVGLYKFTNDPRINILLQSQNKWNLQIRYTQPRDAGLYECQVGTVGSKKISQVFNLTVKNAQALNMRRSEKPTSRNDHIKLNDSYIDQDNPRYPKIYLDARFTLVNNSLNGGESIRINVLCAILTIFSWKNLISLILISLF